MTFLTILFTSSLIMSMIMLLLLAFSFLTRTTITARARYAMWVILLIGLVIPFRPILGKGLITLNHPFEQNMIQDEATMDVTYENLQQEEPVSADQTAPPETIQKASWLSRLSAIDIVFIIWALGAIILFAKYMIEYRRFQRIVKRWGVEVTDPITLETYEFTKGRMGLEEKDIPLLICNTISTPMLTGLFKPVILLPDKDISDEEMELILEHELTHYKHKDLLVNLLGITALCLHWFNPILYLCFPTIYGDGESYCDETVLKNKDKDYRRFYGEVIISMIETSPAKPIALSTCFYAKKLSIKRRLYSIMETNKKMKNLSAASIAAVLTMTMVSGSVVVFANPQRQAKNTTIGVEKAKQIALRDAGLKSDQVSFVKAKLSKDDTVAVYDVEFYSGNVEYDYEINAKNGKIREKDRDIENYSVPKNSVKQQKPSTQKNVSNQGGKTISGKTIGVNKAKEIALRDAGLKSNQVAFVKAKLDTDDGISVYDVEFYSNGVEYDYEIDARSGAIREKDRDIENYTIPKKPVTQQNAPSPNAKQQITLDQAKKIALNAAGIKSGKATFVKAKLTKDDGVAVYDIEFYNGNVEYDYEIDAVTGMIRESDRDIENYAIPSPRSERSERGDNQNNGSYRDDDDDDDRDQEDSNDDDDRDDD